MGQTGFVAENGVGASAFQFGTSGVLTNPSQDQRTWVWGHLYDTGELEVSASATPDASRTLLSSGRVCTNAHYLTAMAMPWYDGRVNLTSCAFLYDLSGTTIASIDYWFYSMTSLVAVTGWANVHGLTSLKQTFNGCTELATLSLAGLDPSSLAELGFTFAGCTNLVTIYADASWTLPDYGVSGMGTFYNCRNLVGGNGTAYSSSAYGYAMMVVDQVGQAGYLTARKRLGGRPRRSAPPPRTEH